MTMRLFSQEVPQDKNERYLAAKAAREMQQRMELRQNIERMLWSALAIATIFAAALGSLVYISDLISR